MDTAIRDAILPAIEARRQKIIDMDAQMARVGVETPAEGSNHAMTRVIVSVDGEQDMFMTLEAALQEVLAAQPAPGAGRSAEGIKWAGGCSLVQQPCDVSRCFPMLTVEMKKPVVDSHPPFERWLSHGHAERVGAGVPVGLLQFPQGSPGASFCCVYSAIDRRRLAG